MKTLVRAGRLIDGTGAPAREGAGILVDDGRIAWVGAEAGWPAGLDPDEESTRAIGPSCRA